MVNEHSPRCDWLPFDTVKETDQAVKIVLRPVFKGMMMALGTLHPHAEKCLTDSSSEFFVGLDRTVKIGRTIRTRISCRRD